MPAFSAAQLRDAVMAKLREEGTAAHASADVNESPLKAESGIGAAPYAALLGGEGADIATTLAAKGRGAKEGNPLMGDFGPGAMLAKGGTAAVMALLMKHLASHGHPKLAKGLGYGSGIGLGAAAIHNMGVAR